MGAQRSRPADPPLPPVRPVLSARRPGDRAPEAREIPAHDGLDDAIEGDRFLFGREGL